jgi:hypothetical protein
MGFWGFTGDMEIQREHEKRGRRGGRFPVDCHRAMRDVTWDPTGGMVARKNISEAAYRRDNEEECAGLAGIWQYQKIVRKQGSSEQ